MYRRTLPVKFSEADVSHLPAELSFIEEYLKDLPSHVKAGEGILLSGPPGVGKTYAIAAMTKEASKGVPSSKSPEGEIRYARLKDFVFATGPMLFEEYALPYDAGDKDRTRDYESAQWLVINDLGKEQRAGGHEKQVSYKLGRLLRHRVESQLVTHITTNLLFHASEDSQGQSIQEIYGESIYSLLMEACPFRYLVNGPDLRVNQAES